ncbi:uncharacterized protein LOC114193105 isoform X2 [Vigna unguiculata]|uniref:uncharacterized protein LOC114193105 isoform X2 n=1 Tax=Vigna unguiculata TaxID=3917 RepID=UPI00101609A3|nr:uncharacterized protein LOC114193105 isoform X2 [Vigna unguiculata]
MDEMSLRVLDNIKLLFDVICLHFVGLVLNKKWVEAVLFAQKYIAHFGNHPVYGQKVKDFMSLLAYKDPLESPMSGLVGEDFRQQVLESLNLAILAHLNLPQLSAMEVLIRQTTVVRDILMQLEWSPPFSLSNFLSDRFTIY